MLKEPNGELDAGGPVAPVFQSQGFFYLWLAQIISQTAQNAILYTLLILVIALTGSAASTSVLVVLFIVPTVVFGIFSGVLVDRGSKRHLLIITNIARAVAALAFFFTRDHLLGLYAVTIVFASFSQLFTTTNAASIPFLVSRRQLMSANSLFSMGFTIAQVLGLILLAPLLLKTTNAATVFITTMTAFVIASVLGYFLPYIGHEDERESASLLPRAAELRGAISQFVQALSSLRSDPMSVVAMGHITASSTLVLIFAVMVPRYMQAILDRDPADAVTVFAPVVVGALIGLRAIPFIAARLGKNRTVAVGLFGLAICLIAFGFVETIATALERTDRLNPFGTETDRLFGQSILVTITIAFAGPLGFSYALLNAPAQTLLHERTPLEMRGRIFASQMVLANGVALIPLVVVGGIADLYGVSAVVLGLGTLLLVGGAATLYLERRWLGGEGDWPPPSQEPVSGSIDTT
ncbi:MAG: MFS transporter [Dehalococcoidia bacterium]